ncbi:MAG: glycosyltransferase [Atopobiaceae bacterium]|jgi:glycosyltransferase involved in cell wall biosynthesis|nr:glycosyltransferase [Atopobiaceae bacterium]MCH4276899.1 glycosyltransferase [Atopobiaceae bacterium]MCI1226343.1 glycosyltransferase [Atopobiaceae bacterium]MDD3177570.1 glycosyltransferase [Atopobiaceae bacterium]MDD4380667.1 glycosyltransferase [Atopobiaceae bacterium]
MEALRAAHRQGKRCALLLYERESGDDATFRYFGRNVSECLSLSTNSYAVCIYVEELDLVKDELLGLVDLIVLIRMRIRPDVWAFSLAAKGRLIRIAYLVDDDVLGLLAAPRVIDAMVRDKRNTEELAFWYGCCNRFELMSSVSDCFIGSTTYLTELLSARYNKPSYTLRSFLSEGQARLSNELYESRRERRGEPFTIGYFSGTASHDRDFSILSGALSSFLLAENAQLLIVGDLLLDSSYDEITHAGRLIRLPIVDMACLQALQATVDVALAPLVIDDFTNCKSALKVFEAGAVGTPTCASSVSSYCEAIDDGRSGFVCRSEQDWIAGLQSCLADREDSGSIGKAARNKALSERYGAVPMRNIEQVLAGACECPIHHVPLSEERAIEELISKDVDWGNPFTVNPLFATPAGRSVSDRR